MLGGCQGSSGPRWVIGARWSRTGAIRVIGIVRTWWGRVVWSRVDAWVVTNREGRACSARGRDDLERVLAIGKRGKVVALEGDDGRPLAQIILVRFDYFAIDFYMRENDKRCARAELRPACHAPMPACVRASRDCGDFVLDVAALGVGVRDAFAFGCDLMRAIDLLRGCRLPERLGKLACRSPGRRTFRLGSACRAPRTLRRCRP